MYHKILVPIDRFIDSHEAVDNAAAFANAFKSEVVLLHCYSYPELLSDEFLVHGIAESYIQKIKENIENNSQKFLQEIKDKFSEKQVNVSIELREGSPGKSIISFAEEQNIDLIVIGSRHMGTLKRLVFTSTSSYVLHHSKIPVCVV